MCVGAARAWQRCRGDESWGFFEMIWEGVREQEEE